VRMTRSAIRPQLISPTSAIASSMEAQVWVAPNSMAFSRLNSTGSTATIARAPAAAAPWTELIPIPPLPTTTTTSPSLAPPISVADPQPVATPQPSRAALSSGMSFSILTTEDWWTVTYGENVPRTHIEATGSPAAVWTRYVSSLIARPVSRPAPLSQRFWSPSAQGGQVPQAGMNARTTWSPSSIPVTPSPTLVTTPAPSCPPMMG